MNNKTFKNLLRDLLMTGNTDAFLGFEISREQYGIIMFHRGVIGARVPNFSEFEKLILMRGMYSEKTEVEKELGL